MDAKWYRLARYDSAVVSMNDGASAALYQRDPEKFRELTRKTIEIHERLRREWPRLAEEYRSKLAEITSPEAWDETFRPWTGRRHGWRRGGRIDEPTPCRAVHVVDGRRWPRRRRTRACWRSSGAATCSSCWCAARSAPATRARSWGCCGPTSTR